MSRPRDRGPPGGMTRVVPALLVALGIVILLETAWLGGGVVGFVFGSLFVLTGAGRLWLQARQ
jgi:hypothetical protein